MAGSMLLHLCKNKVKLVLWKDSDHFCRYLKKFSLKVIAACTFFTAVYIIERLVLQKIYVLNKKIL